MELSWRQQVETRQRLEQIVPLHRREILEEGRPGICLVKPVLPAFVELVFERGREMPERHAPWRTEQLITTAASHRKHHVRLCKGVCTWKATGEHDGTMPPKHAPAVPPARRVHLTMTGDHEAQLEETGEID